MANIGGVGAAEHEGHLLKNSFKIHDYSGQSHILLTEASGLYWLVTNQPVEVGGLAAPLRTRP